MGKILDFDQFIQEHEKRELDVIVLGDTYKVPLTIPAIVPVMMARAEESLNPQDSTKMVMRAADAMFGAENVNKMCRKGLGAKDLAKLIEKLFAEINAGDEDEEAQDVSDEDSRVQAKSGKSAKK